MFSMTLKMCEFLSKGRKIAIQSFQKIKKMEQRLFSLWWPEVKGFITTTHNAVKICYLRRIPVIVGDNFWRRWFDFGSALPLAKSWWRPSVQATNLLWQRKTTTPNNWSQRFSLLHNRFSFTRKTTTFHDICLPTAFPLLYNTTYQCNNIKCNPIPISS